MNKTVVIVAIVMLFTGLGAGYWLANSQKDIKQTTAAEITKKVLFYRNPMNPDVTSPVPMQGSMGMDYVPVYQDENSGNNEPSGTV